MPRVVIRGMSFEKGLRLFRKKTSHIKEEVREREFYTKPNVKRNATNNYRKRTRELEKAKSKETERIRKRRMNRGVL